MSDFMWIIWIEFINKIKTFRKSVRLGEYQISSDKDCVEDNCADPPINLTIEKKIVHELYRPASVQQEHDIALLRLSQPVKYTSICWMLET